MSQISANHATFMCNVFVFKTSMVCFLMVDERQYVEQKIIRMKNANHLEAAGFTELQFPFLKSVEDSVSIHIDGSFGDFYLEHIVIL